ncbi:hypothetical protein [Staphylococcus sp. HMSC65H10]|uniref:hypothetical protein n=1 Tax=Staphylococcus sp. HMSC65H10 TaxID=1608889 RepID=UPI0008AA06E2|nr:hypothetical protein [Staphylococcus sp. HMSC65H10]OHS43420.1 hypothetical protein HMPREF3270_06355 [Staphylococcus sp. HMSC65H10]
MSREISHRYLKDKEGEFYFPVTHIDAIQGIPTEEGDPFKNIDSKIKKINDSIDKNDATIYAQRKILDNLVGDTGWVDVSIPDDMKNNAVKNGFKSGIREVRVGNNLTSHLFVVRSIRLNVSNITGSNMQIAQLPIGFITDNQSFLGRQNGYRNPITIECTKDGKVTAFVHPDEQNKTNWVYQEFTWLE